MRRQSDGYQLCSDLCQDATILTVPYQIFSRFNTRQSERRGAMLYGNVEKGKGNSLMSEYA